MVRVAISRLTDTRLPTAWKLKNPTTASTMMTSSEIRNGFAASRVPTNLAAIMFVSGRNRLAGPPTRDEPDPHR